MTFLCTKKTTYSCIVEHNPESNIRLIEHKKVEHPNVSPTVSEAARKVSFSTTIATITQSTNLKFPASLKTRQTSLTWKIIFLTFFIEDGRAAKAFGNCPIGPCWSCLETIEEPGWIDDWMYSQLTLYNLFYNYEFFENFFSGFIGHQMFILNVFLFDKESIFWIIKFQNMRVNKPLIQVKKMFIENNGMRSTALIVTAQEKLLDTKISNSQHNLSRW